MSNITREENELLTRTGPGTAMGKVFRQYWIPATLSERLPEPDGPPIQLQLLGERLVAFRDSKGRVGLLDEFCPHRRVSLVYGRNEECGLRCVYHGWKLDVDGKVVETPAELNQNFGASIRHTAYPTREAGGIIWTYMGPPEEQPPFPEFLFTKLPAHQRYVFHYHQECNYLQALEGDLDVSHPSFLHSRLDKTVIDERRAAMMADKSPKTFAREDAYGLQTVWIWKASQEKQLFWVDPFIAPCFTITPSGRTRHRFVWHAWVPINDHEHYAYYCHYDPEAEHDPEERDRVAKIFGHDMIDPANGYRAKGMRNNMYVIDHDMQRTRNYTGIEGIAFQDVAITHSMGPIVDRSLENVGSQDILVVRLRHFLLKLIRQKQEGQTLPGLDPQHPYTEIDTRMVITPTGTTPQDVLAHREWRWGEAGT